MSRGIGMLAAMLLVSFAANAQTYSGVVRRNFWNDGANAVGIRQDSVSVSYAELYGSYVEGNLRGSSEAASAWTFGAKASTIMHLGKFSMIGSFGFEQMEGEGMAASMFVRPGYYPINVYEFTPGHKTLQTYSFSGGISVDIAPNWRIGGKMDFESSNFSKRKDLRHTNYRLDLTVAPGVQYHNGDFAIGLNYIFSKNSETVNAEQVGSTVASYEAFFDKGLFYGVREIWTGSGTHLNDTGTSGLPVSEMIHGVSLQASYGPAYAEVSFRGSNGQAGEKQTVWFRFPGWNLDARAGYRLNAGKSSHTFRLTFNHQNQDNYETVLEKVTVGGVTNTVEHGSNLIYSRRITNLAFDYGFSCGRWSAGLNAAFNDQEGRVSMMYPYVFRQSLLRPSAEGRVQVSVGKFDFALSARWSNGYMIDYQDKVDSGSGVVETPRRLDSYQEKYREHMTCHKIWIVPRVRWNFWHGLYAEASLNWNKGFEIQYLTGDWRTSAWFRFGYNF